MVIGIIGENCTGKSTLAAEIQKRLGGEIVTGKDYLRLAKSEAMAAALFKKRMKEAMTGENILYVISEGSGRLAGLSMMTVSPLIIFTR